MEWYGEFSAVILGLALRFGIPLALTILVALTLRRLDERWNKDAQAHRVQLVAAGALPSNTGCWNIMGCSTERRLTCKAYTDQDKPCWQVFREDDGTLKPSCLRCKIFKHSPVPVTS